MPDGIVEWFDAEQGIGMIHQQDETQKVTVERAAVYGGDARRGLLPGDRVRFGITRDKDGVRADNIRRIPPGDFRCARQADC
ncbi:cold shock domain-containing protein [Streptomyces sp. ET3-23]|uniref:cold-shock protein n=1 Tax=Streptomyces sp. ET3-23 TaxID=2885643 RepID=UPI001D0F8FA3|nr:cold shock domain-containing protein [Streptomyces sp. ET3-23]MCC2275229.1 cold shock domain-containing protein [Streptomyces sp. ET3-23]